MRWMLNVFYLCLSDVSVSFYPLLGGHTSEQQISVVLAGLASPLLLLVTLTFYLSAALAGHENWVYGNTPFLYVCPNR